LNITGTTNAAIRTIYRRSFNSRLIFDYEQPAGERGDTNNRTRSSINHEPEGERLQMRLGERCTIRVSAADTDGSYSVVEIVADPGDRMPLHVHQNEDEHFLVLEGTARIASGDQTFDATAGTAVVLGKGVPHAWGNLSHAPLRIMNIFSPGGIEEKFVRMRLRKMP
jgi:mannose-6-phosphate isomerase-like protein (cupin superfamily)